MLFVERCSQSVAPASDCLHDPPLDPLDVVVIRDAVRAVDDVVHADQQRLGQLEAPVEVVAPELLQQDRPHTFSVLGVEPIAGDADQTGHEPVQRIAPQKQPQPLALSQAEDPHPDLEQLVRLHLKQRVARVGFEDLDQRLEVVGAGFEAGAVEHGTHLVPQQRDPLRALLICEVGEQAEKAALADDLAVF